MIVAGRPASLLCDADNAYLVPFARKKLEQLWDRHTQNPGLAKMVVAGPDGEQVEVAIAGGAGRIRIIGGGASVPLVVLGSLAPTINVSGGKPVGAESVTFTAAQLLGALLTTPSIVYVNPYMSVASACVLASSLFGVTPTNDPQAGTIAIPTIIGAVKEFDFGAGKVWAEYQTVSIDTQRSWASISLDEFANLSFQTFPVAYTTVLDADHNQVIVIADGIQTFALPMAGGRFTLNINVTFLGGVPVSSSPNGSLGAWTYTRIRQEMTDETNIKITYTQAFNGRRVFLSTGERNFSFPPSIPLTGDADNNFSVEYLIQPLVSVRAKAPAVAPAYLWRVLNTQEVHVFATIDGVFQAVFRSDSSSTSYFARKTDGSDLEMTGPEFTFANNDLFHSEHPAPNDPVQYVAFGDDGSSSSAMGTYASATAANDADFTYAAGQYSVRVRRPPGTPAADEFYDVLSGASVVRSALRSKGGVFANDIRESSNINTSTLAGDSVLDTNSGSDLLVNWQRDMYPTYDAALSIAPEVCVVVKINVSTPALKSTTIALLPFGWGSVCTAQMRLLEFSGNPARAILVAMKGEIQAALTRNTGFVDTAPLSAHIAFLDQQIFSIDNPTFDEAGASHPTRKEVLDAVVGYFVAQVSFLTGSSITARVALSAGVGTFLLVDGA